MAIIGKKIMTQIELVLTFLSLAIWVGLPSGRGEAGKGRSGKEKKNVFPISLSPYLPTSLLSFLADLR